MNRFLTTHKNWMKMQHYAQHAYNKWKAEIGGMAVMVESPSDSEKTDIKKGDWVLMDPVILKQEVSGGNCDLDKDALAQYYGKTAMKYKDMNFRFCWWHSHHTMAAFWSSTDLKAIDEFNEGDISFALVINLKQEYKFRVSIWKPIEVHQDVEFEVIGLEGKSVPDAIQTEVEELCSKETVINKGYSGYSGWGTARTTGYKLTGNQQQATLWDKSIHEPMLNNPTTQALSQSPEDIKEYLNMVDSVKELNHNYIMGELSYTKYKNRVNKINAQADEEGFQYKIILMHKGELFDAIQHNDDHDFVEYEDIDDGWGGYSHGI